MNLVSSTIQPLFDFATVINPIQPRQYICEWVVNDYVVRLFKDKDILDYKTFCRRKHVLICHEEVRLLGTADETIAQLKSSKVIVDEDGWVTFVPCHKTWQLEDHEVNLIQRKRDLMWYVQSIPTLATSIFNFKLITIPSKRCHHYPLLGRCYLDNFVYIPDTFDRIKKIWDSPSQDENIVSLQDDFKVVRVISKEACTYGDVARYLKCIGIRGEVVVDSGRLYFSNLVFAQNPKHSRPKRFEVVNFDSLLNENPHVCSMVAKIKELRSLFLPNSMLIEIEPISVQSKIDPRVLVSKFMWAVTLIATDSSKGSIASHADIIIEGISDGESINNGFFDDDFPRLGNAKPVPTGKYFMYKAGYSPHIESGIFSCENLRYKTRTDIWMRTSSKIKKMISAIENQKLQELQKIYVPFGILGRDTIIPYKMGRDNCFTWARIHFETIDIIFEKKWKHLLFSSIDSYTNKEKHFRDKTQVQEI